MKTEITKINKNFETQIEHHKQISKLQNLMIISYKKLCNSYSKIFIVSNIVWFWLGYLYGMNGWIITALIVQIIGVIIWIIGEKLK